MREEKWKSRLDRDPKQFIVLVATDAMRLAMLKPTKNFPPSVVIAWLSTVAATKRTFEEGRVKHTSEPLARVLAVLTALEATGQ